MFTYWDLKDFPQSSSDKSCEFYVDIHFVTIINFSYFQCESACLISILFDVSAECILPFYSTTRHFNVYLTPSYTFLHTIHLPVLGFSLILSLILPYLILSSPHLIYTENKLEQFSLTSLVFQFCRHFFILIYNYQQLI